MCGVETNTQPLRLAHATDDVSEMLEFVSNTRALAGRCFESNSRLHFGNARVHAINRSDNFLEPSFFTCAKMRARMQHEEWQFELIGASQFFGKSAQRVRMKLGIGCGEVDRANVAR